MSSCGDSVFALEGSDAMVAVGAVAVRGVVSDAALGRVPVAVIGHCEHELLDWAKVALDLVEIAGVGGVGTS
jgi:hypothetical protein